MEKFGNAALIPQGPRFLLRGVVLCSRCVRGRHCAALAKAEGEVGPLFSRLPGRHLTGHGEVWLDQGSQNLRGYMSAQSLILGWQNRPQHIFFFLLICHLL